MSTQRTQPKQPSALVQFHNQGCSASRGPAFQHRVQLPPEVLLAQSCFRERETRALAHLIR